LLFGYDFFISYPRRDASNYVLKFASDLKERGHTCFIDQWGTAPGKALPRKLKNKIRSCSVFILIGSNSALNSIAVDEEIDLFLPTKRAIIPVAFQNIDKARWFSKIEGIAVFYEQQENITSSSPAKELVDRAVNSFSYTKQANRIRYMAYSALGLILIAIVVSVIFGRKVNEQEAKLDANEITLQKSQNEIDSTKAAIKIQKAELVQVKAQIVEVEIEKEAAEREAMEFQIQVKEKTRLAKANLFLAEAGNAISNNGQFGDNQFDYYALMKAARLGLESYKLYPTQAARSKLEAYISQLGEITFQKNFGGNVIKVDYDASSGKIALLEKKESRFRISLFDVKKGRFDWRTEFNYRLVHDLKIRYNSVYISHFTNEGGGELTALFTIPPNNTIRESSIYKAPNDFIIEDIEQWDSRLLCMLRKYGDGDATDDGKLAVIKQNSSGKYDSFESESVKMAKWYPALPYSYNENERLVVVHNRDRLNIFKIGENEIERLDSIVIDPIERLFGFYGRNNVLFKKEHWQAADVSTLSLDDNSYSDPIALPSTIYLTHLDDHGLNFSTAGVNEFQMVGIMSLNFNTTYKDRLIKRVLINDKVIGLTKSYGEIAILSKNGSVTIAKMSFRENMLRELTPKQLIQKAEKRIVDVMTKKEKEDYLLN
jgi:hypothetical protein